MKQRSSSKTPPHLRLYLTLSICMVNLPRILHVRHTLTSRPTLIGHDFYVLAQKENAQWNGDISTLKMDNPIRRDTASLPAKGYLVLAFESDNPGAWLMHCHIPFHIAGGLGVQFLERVDEIKGSIGSLSGMQEGCASWKKFDADYVGNQNGSILIEGDSGLKRRQRGF